VLQILPLDGTALLTKFEVMFCVTDFATRWHCSVD
jgi:hypothetical protein